MLTLRQTFLPALLTASVLAGVMACGSAGAADKTLLRVADSAAAFCQILAADQHMKPVSSGSASATRYVARWNHDFAFYGWDFAADGQTAGFGGRLLTPVASAVDLPASVSIVGKVDCNVGPKEAGRLFAAYQCRLNGPVDFSVHNAFVRNDRTQYDTITYRLASEGMVTMTLSVEAQSGSGPVFWPTSCSSEPAA